MKVISSLLFLFTFSHCMLLTFGAFVPSPVGICEHHEKYYASGTQIYIDCFCHVCYNGIWRQTEIRDPDCGICKPEENELNSVEPQPVVFKLCKKKKTRMQRYRGHLESRLLI